MYLDIRQLFRDNKVMNYMTQNDSTGMEVRLYKEGFRYRRGLPLSGGKLFSFSRKGGRRDAIVWADDRGLIIPIKDAGLL